LDVRRNSKAFKKEGVGQDAIRGFKEDEVVKVIKAGKNSFKSEKTNVRNNEQLESGIVGVE